MSEYPNVAVAYKLGPNGEEIPLTDDEMTDLDARFGHELDAAMHQSPDYAVTTYTARQGEPIKRSIQHYPIPPATRQSLEVQWRREDIIRRACAQVALQSVNKVLGVK